MKRRYARPPMTRPFLTDFHLQGLISTASGLCQIFRIVLYTLADNQLNCDVKKKEIEVLDFGHSSTKCHTNVFRDKTHVFTEYELLI